MTFDIALLRTTYSLSLLIDYVNSYRYPFIAFIFTHQISHKFSEKVFQKNIFSMKSSYTDNMKSIQRQVKRSLYKVYSQTAEV